MPPFETLTLTQLGVEVEEEVTIKSSITAENDDDDDDDEDNGDDEINTPTQTHTRAIVNQFFTNIVMFGIEFLVITRILQERKRKKTNDRTKSNPYLTLLLLLCQNIKACYRTSHVRKSERDFCYSPGRNSPFLPPVSVVQVLSQRYHLPTVSRRQPFV